MDVRRQIFTEIRKFLKRYFSDSQIKSLSKVVVAEILAKESQSAQHSEDFSIPIYDLVNTIITYADINLDKANILYLLLDLSNYTIERGLFTLAQDINWRIISKTSNDSKLKNIRGHSLLAIGEIFSRSAKWDQCLLYVQKAKKIFESEKDFPALAKAENLIGTIYGEQGKIDKAEKHFKSGLTFLNPNKDKMMTADIETNLGNLYLIQNRIDLVYIYYSRALTIFKELKNNRRQAEVYQNLGMLFLKQKKLKQSIKHFDKCIELAVKSNLLPILGICYASKAQAYFDKKDYEAAWEYSEKSMVISFKIDDKLTIADIYQIKGCIKNMRGKQKEAEYYLLSSLKINSDLCNDLNYAETCVALGLLYKNMSVQNQTVSYFSIALQYYSKVGDHENSEYVKKLISS